MYSYEERLRAVELYIKLGKRAQATILGRFFQRAARPGGPQMAFRRQYGRNRAIGTACLRLER